MADRLDRVTVRTPSGDVTLTWAARDALVEKLGLDSLRPVFFAFVYAGVGRPVHIGEAHAAQVADVIEAIGESSPDWLVALEGGLFELRTALRERPQTGSDGHRSGTEMGQKRRAVGWCPEPAPSSP